MDIVEYMFLREDMNCLCRMNMSLEMMYSLCSLMGIGSSFFVRRSILLGIN